MIRSECVVSLKKCHFVMAECSKCKSEIRVEAGKEPVLSCPVCRHKYDAAQEFALVQISEAINELKKSSGCDVWIITVE